MPEQKHILALISDLFFIPRVQSVANELGHSFSWVDTYKTTPEFLNILQERQADLIVLDLNSPIPWAEWLPAAKASPFSAHIPWLVFGSHMNPRRLAAARHAGADKVVPKSQFSSELGDLVQSLLNP
jgi:CheY-like chemotaxis protein